MKKPVFTLTKIVERYDEHNFYYTVDNGAFKWFFYDLVKAENFIKSNNATYDYKEIQVDWILD